MYGAKRWTFPTDTGNIVFHLCFIINQYLTQKCLGLLDQVDVNVCV